MELEYHTCYFQWLIHIRGDVDISEVNGLIYYLENVKFRNFANWAAREFGSLKVGKFESWKV